MSNESIGILMLCAMCFVPLVLGIVIGWRANNRYQQLGWPWVLFPEFIKRIWEMGDENN